MLSVRLLGVPRLLVDGQDISASIQYRKGWALVGYLAIERSRRHSREHLAQLLWPALAPAAARTNLRQVIANLNRVFERHGAPDLLDPARDAMALLPAAAADLDVLWLEQAAERGIEPVDLPLFEPWADGFGGEFLEGLAFGDCPEFDEWLQDERRRLAAATARAMQAVLDVQRGAGRRAQAVETGQRLAALDPWDEASQRQLMSVLAEDGRHDQAIAVYERLCDSLEAELGSEPTPATSALRDAIAADASGPPGDARPRFGRTAGERHWMSAVYCQWRAPAAASTLDDVVAYVEREGGRILAPTANAVLACFVDDSGALGTRGTEVRAARGAIGLRARFDGLSMAMCSGLVRIDAHTAAASLIGNPVEWVFELCGHAAADQVLVCDAIADSLRDAFDLRCVGPAEIAGLGAPVELWALDGERPVRSALPSLRRAPRGVVRVDGDTDRLRSAPDLHTQPLRGDEAPAASVPALAWLTVVEGEDRGKRVGLGGRPVIVGRASDSDLQISHRTVSRHHCVFWSDGHAYRLRDLGATNRTRVNGAAVQDVWLEHGDAIALGDSVLRFERRLDPPTVPVRRAG